MRFSEASPWFYAVIGVAALAGAVAAAGCGEAVPSANASSTRPSKVAKSNKRAATREPVAAEAAEVLAIKPSNVVGALERPHALRRFFDALDRVEGGRAVDDVRIVQFGDSHTAADIQTGITRRALQAKFGDGGRGFVAVGKPWKGYVQEGVRCGMSSEFSPERGRLERGSFSGDGLYGLSGIALDTGVRNARAWADIAPGTHRAEIDYLERPGGGSFDVFVDGVRVVRVATRGDWTASAYRSFELEAGSAHQLEVRSVGDGAVRVFGVSLDRQTHGVVYDALGINGARISTCLQWNEAHFDEQLRHRDPALVVLAYGTNESTDESTPSDVYERQLVDMLGRVARAVPSASCLLLGPPDRAVRSGDRGWTTSTKLLEIIASQRRVAEAAGCAFYNQLEAMGGAGTVATWAAEDPPRARPDRVHLTREGYAELGSTFAADLLRAYESHRRERGSAAKP